MRDRLNLPHLQDQHSIDVVLLIRNSGMPGATAFSKGNAIESIVKQYGRRVPRSIAARAADAYDAFRADEDERMARESDPLHGEPVRVDLVGHINAPGWFFLKQLDRSRVPSRTNDKAGAIVRFARRALTKHALVSNTNLTRIYDDGDLDADGPMAHIDALDVVLGGVYGERHKCMVEITSESIQRIKYPLHTGGLVQASL